MIGIGMKRIEHGHTFRRRGGSAGSVPFHRSFAVEAKACGRPDGVDRGDWILCQITSNAYGDHRALPIRSEHFETGSLQRESFARPGKLFTASRNLMTKEVGQLRKASLDALIAAVVQLLKP